MHRLEAFLSGVGVELLVNLLQPLLHYPEWVQWAGIALGAMLVLYGSFLPLAKQAVRYVPASTLLFPRSIRDSVHWAHYAPAITPMNADIGARFEFAEDGQTVSRARTYASFELRNRSPFGRALVSFVDCRMEVKPRMGRVRKWHRLPLGATHQNIEVTIPIGESRNQALEFVSRWEGDDVARNPRLDFDFDWKLTGITGRLIDGDLAGRVQEFRGRHLGRVDR